MLLDITPEMAKRLTKSDRLPSPPVVALRLIELSRDPEVDFGAVAETISTDPALTAKIERVVHSPLYGLRGEVRSLRQALTLLGLRETVSMALSYSVVGALRSISGGYLDYEYFWQRSLLSATSARVLGKKLRRLDYEDLFLSALLQDIGMLALDQAMPDIYEESALKQVDHDALRLEEQARIGFDHAQIGAWLLEIWGLPGNVQRAVRFSDNANSIPEDLEDRGFVEVVALSGALADIWMASDWESAYARAADIGCSRLDLLRSDIDIVVGAVGDMVGEIETLFDITLIAPEQLARIAEEARDIGILQPASSHATAD